MPQPPAYQPRRAASNLFVPARGWNHHFTVWGDPSLVSPERPALVLAHGYMDVGASFQFLVDELAALEGSTRYIVALDWRGFGLSAPEAASPHPDNYHFVDYLGDLDAVLDAPALGLAPDKPLDLLGHSMGGNIVMSYAGVRPARIRRLINLEGFGLPVTQPEHAPGHLARWLNQLKTAQSLKDYDSLDGVAQRLRKTNPRLAPERADWLAQHWSRQGPEGRWQILGDAAHKRMSAMPYRVDEVLATWRAIQAPVLWVEGDLTDLAQWWGERYSHAEFDARLSEVHQVERQRLSPCGHMLHHDQPAALAAHLQRFLA
jgi:pimeloyl-ACP methyl ester carboxylesterase